jgi:hypothetical protein
MKRLTKLLLFAALALCVVAPAAAGSNYKIKGEVEAQSGGYRHVVIVKNKTRDWLSCEVWTDVDPQHKSLRVGPRNKQSVVMRTRAERDEFIPYGYCRNN